MAEEGVQGPAPRRALIAWCVYDWANSGFPTVIVTFVFSAYFARGIAATPTEGTAMWGYALSLSGILIAVASPVFGAVADASGRRKPWLGTFSVLCIAATLLLWFARPDPAYALYALAVFVIANSAFEIGTVFYNAMLPALVPPARIGRWSGWGWGLGYAGGLACLVIVLVAFVQAPVPPFGLDRGDAEHIRAVAPLVALWFAIFAIPVFAFTPDEPRTGVAPGEAVRNGLKQIVGTARRIRSHANIGRFLLARLLYIDGLNTLFAFGGIYAAGSFGMDTAEIVQFGIALNVAAGLGAAGFAWIDDWIGAKRTILIAVAGIMGFGIPLLLVETKTMFWVLAVPLGIFFGPAQSASRSLMARLAPPELRNEMFGLFALSGKITAFLGPATLAWATQAFDSQRAGMATIMLFLTAGFLLMLTVREQPE